MHLNYFAYGSNMHPLRLQQRVPSCQALGLARLSGYTLRFHKDGLDNSGKCNVWHTGKTADQVIGVIYQILAAEKPLLDQAEGLGWGGYHEKTVNLSFMGSEHPAFLYFADTAYVNDTLKPYTWYKELVINGARVHQVPEFYLEQLEQVVAIEDSDSVRNKVHQNILKMHESAVSS